MSYTNVFSTCVEVILTEKSGKCKNTCILHVCGGDPIFVSSIKNRFLYSPRVWRWSYFLANWSWWRLVFSTCVEVILCSNVICPVMWGILHVCGGDPIPIYTKTFPVMYSPRVWRWSQSLWNLMYLSSVFSTCVEVIPFQFRSLYQNMCILHVCGGDPFIACFSTYIHKYSPRVWRWSRTNVDPNPQGIVFSTCVEVIPLGDAMRTQIGGILHVCGGDPEWIILFTENNWYSPRVWRWSLLPIC